MINFLSKLWLQTRTVIGLGVILALFSVSAMAAELSPATQKLFDAVHKGDLAQVQVSIAGGGDINAVNEWGITAVDLAVDKGHFDIVHFLLQVRDLQVQKTKPAPVPAPATVTSMSTPGQPASPPPVPQVPAAAQVAEVYTPPPGAGPWSATVVTSEPPPPPKLSDGPSPFDRTADTGTPLPIIGTVRGPVSSGQSLDTRVQVAAEETFQKVVEKPKQIAKPAAKAAPKSLQPKNKVKKPTGKVAEIKLQPEQVTPANQEDEGIWDNIKSFLNLEGEQKAKATPKPKRTPKPKPKLKSKPVIAKTETTKKSTVNVTSAPRPAPPPPLTAEEKSRPVVEVRQSASLARPTAPVSPPNVKGPPPPIDGKVMPESVSAAPIADLPKDDLETPQVVPVKPLQPVKTAKKNTISVETPSEQTQPLPPNTTAAKVTRITGTDRRKRQQADNAVARQKPVKVGTTTPPGKPREQKGFFSKVMSIFSSDDEEKQADNKKSAAGKSSGTESGDWSVKEVQQAKVVPRKPTRKVVRELPDRRLDGVVLSVGRTTALGKEPPPQAPAPWYYKSCINKKLGSTVFCIETLDWPADIRAFFLTDSILYEGTQAIVRYDEGAATYFHILFPSKSYSSIVNFFSRRYGPPSQKLKRSIAPLAEQRRLNPTVIWQSITPVTNLLTTLEIRMYDDNRGGFPDTKRGAIYLYHEWSQPVFPQLSSVELMLLRAEEKRR